MNIISRRSFIALLAAAVLGGCAGNAPRDAKPPLIFVHGNGDTAALWTTMAWRFESNGWPRDRLFALDMPYPLARNDDSQPQEGRTSAAESMQQLAAEVVRVRKLTGADKVVLVGNSRGGYAIRNYIRNGGGAATVSCAVLGGTPNHGVWAGDYLPGSEFNGKGPFLTALNAPQGPEGLETTPGVNFMTLRSDGNDKFAQPDGRWIGQPKMQTNITSDGPALKGAENLVLPGLDHREVSYHRLAFVQTYRFITGEFPGRSDIAPEAAVVLDGRITGFRGNDPSNLPIAGASMEIFETNAQTGERIGGAVHAKTVGPDGQWGPFTAKPDASYEFVIRAEGFAVTHIYRSPFPRSSSLVHLRPARIADADRDAGAVVTMTRPRGYFGVGRDSMSLDGVSPPPGLPPGVPGVAASKLKLKETTVRSVAAVFNGERIVVRSWPLNENHLVFAEFHY
ncbi:MAG TPA: alpha/beta fold hydrolase [Burkholderiales bacterium]|nr:alpha/beta fold hydrolase [Burkholderiales bacterium]